VTFTWLAEVSPVSESDISNAYRKLVSEFELGMNVPVPENFVDRIGSEVSLSLHKILQAVTDAGEHIGQSPPGMAAAALYGAAMEAKIEITQAEVAEAAGVSVVTLSRQWQTIKSVLEEMQV
jgi:transcription initiation factor TFIIB